MTTIQIENLLTFFFLYCGIDKSCDIHLTSPDYLMEKYTKIIGVELPDTSYKNFLLNSDLYNTWINRWGNKVPDSLMMVIIETYGKPFTFINLIDTFEKYIGDVNSINKNRYYHIHFKLQAFVSRFIANEISLSDKRHLTLKNII